MPFKAFGGNGRPRYDFRSVSGGLFRFDPESKRMTPVDPGELPAGRAFQIEMDSRKLSALRDMLRIERSLSYVEKATEDTGVLALHRESLGLIADKIGDETGMEEVKGLARELAVYAEETEALEGLFRPPLFRN